MSKYYDHIPYEYRPISMWGYFGYTILFCIPILGLILALVWSFGAGNVKLRNFARTQFCVLIIIGIVLGVCAALSVLGS